DGQFELRWLLNGKIGRLVSIENTGSVNANLAICVRKAGAVAYKTARCCGGRAGCDNHRNPTVDEVGSHLPQPVISTSRPTVFDDDVLTLNVAGFIQAPMKCGHELCE